MPRLSIAKLPLMPGLKPAYGQMAPPARIAVPSIASPRCAGTRIGTYKCYQCRKPFTVKVGTVFEASHVPAPLASGGVSHVLVQEGGFEQPTSSNLGITLKTAWFMSHRIREAMRVVGVEPMGGAGEIVGD